MCIHDDILLYTYYVDAGSPCYSYYPITGIMSQQARKKTTSHYLCIVCKLFIKLMGKCQQSILFFFNIISKLKHLFL